MNIIGYIGIFWVVLFIINSKVIENLVKHDVVLRRKVREIPPPVFFMFYFIATPLYAFPCIIITLLFFGLRFGLGDSDKAWQQIAEEIKNRRDNNNPPPNGI